MAVGAIALLAFFFGRNSAEPPVKVDASYSSDRGGALSLTTTPHEPSFTTPIDAGERQESDEPAFAQPARLLAYEAAPVRVAGTDYFANCSAARAAGAAPVRADDPGYAPHLDRDGDGVGCE